MKHLQIIGLAVLSLACTMTSFAQGALAPPGPPTPTMKTLDQVEPRTPITNATAVTISVPGSYYLTTNIAVATGNAIAISADNVTLDLNGFTLVSSNPAATGYGILLSGARANITILNGHIVGGVTQSGGVYSGSGFDSGIGYGASPRNVRVVGVTVSGCQSSGIYLDTTGTIVESCAVDTVGYVGIDAQTVSDSSARNCGNYGIIALTAHNSFGTAVGSDGTGLYAAYSANNCFGSSTSSGSSINGSSGLSAVNAVNCYGVSTNGYGLNASVANNCVGVSGDGNGVQCFNAINCTGSSSSGIGINCLGIANSCMGSRPGGTAISATTAIGCTPFFGTITAGQKFLGTP